MVIQQQQERPQLTGMVPDSVKLIYWSVVLVCFIAILTLFGVDSKSHKKRVKKKHVLQCSELVILSELWIEVLVLQANSKNSSERLKARKK